MAQKISEADKASMRDLRDTFLKRLGLWTAVGNGAGLLAVGAKFADGLEKPLAAVLLPSLWAFSIGLAGAALVNVALLVEYNNQHDAADAGVEYVTDKRWDRIGLSSALSSILGFGFGVFYPLLIVSITQFRLAVPI